MQKLDADPALLTSLRWLSTDSKNGMARGVLRACRALGVFGRTEEYDSKTAKTKIVFCAAQLAFTVVCFAPTALLYASHAAHLAYLIGVFVIAVYNGGSFYIEVFAQRYHVLLEQKADAVRLRRAGDSSAAIAAVATDAKSK